MEQKHTAARRRYFIAAASLCLMSWLTLLVIANVESSRLSGRIAYVVFFTLVSYPFFLANLLPVLPIGDLSLPCAIIIPVYSCIFFSPLLGISRASTVGNHRLFLALQICVVVIHVCLSVVYLYAFRALLF
jgi:hypothetical protein